MLEPILGRATGCGDNQKYIGRILDIEEKQWSALQAVAQPQSVTSRFPTIQTIENSPLQLSPFPVKIRCSWQLSFALVFADGINEGALPRGFSSLASLLCS